MLDHDSLGCDDRCDTSSHNMDMHSPAHKQMPLSVSPNSKQYFVGVVSGCLSAEPLPLPVPLMCSSGASLVRREIENPLAIFGNDGND